MSAKRTTALVLVVVASVLAFASLPAIWLNRQFLNTDNYTRTSSKLLADPVIRDQVAVFLVDQLYQNVDVESQLRAALPDQLKSLAGPAAGGLRTLAENASRDILARPRAQQAWEDANRAAQLQLLDVLNGGGKTVSTQNGEVVLNLRLLLQQLADRVGVGSKVVSALPPQAAAITILHSDQLKAAQTGTKILKGLPIVLVGLSLACFLVALLVAPDRRRYSVRGYGAGLIVAGAAMLVAISLAGDALVNSLATTASTEQAVRNTWEIVTPLLHQATVATILYGAFLVIGSWLAGPTGLAVGIRRVLAPYLSEPLVAWAGFAAIFAAIVFWWAPTPATRNGVTAVLLIALAAIGWEGLRRKTRREWPGASLEQAMHEHRERLHRLGQRVRGEHAVVQQHALAAPGDDKLDNGVHTAPAKEGTV